PPTAEENASRSANKSKHVERRGGIDWLSIVPLPIRKIRGPRQDGYAARGLRRDLSDTNGIWFEFCFDISCFRPGCDLFSFYNPSDLRPYLRKRVISIMGGWPHCFQPFSRRFDRPVYDLGFWKVGNRCFDSLKESGIA